MKMLKQITSQNCHIIINPDVASRGDYFLENGEWKVIGAKVLSLTHQFDEAGNATFTPATGTVEVFLQQVQMRYWIWMVPGTFTIYILIKPTNST